MGNQSRLVVLSVILTVALAISTPPSTTIAQTNSINDDEISNTHVPSALDPRFNKMLPLPPKVVKEMKPEKKLPLADDIRFNKMLPGANSLSKKVTDSSKNYEDDEYYDNYDNYEDDYYSDEIANKNKTSTASPTGTTTTEKVIVAKKLKPIRGDEKEMPLEENDQSESEDIDDDDDDDSDIEDEQDILYHGNVPCPRDCICGRNVNSYLVATCSRLDADVQKFGSDITDLIVVDVEPKYPILLGPEFFYKIGLKHISSIKISNCTIEYIHPAAFHGLENLYSINLTNVRLTSINPDTFAENKKLRLLTISGNDFSEITKKGHPNSRYLLKSTSVEELDLSNNNLKQLPQSAFSELDNIIYINLAQNNLKDLPEGIFDAVDTIEELDLSSNSIKNLPPNIFNKTALAILHLKYNEITDDLRFGISDLQQLDLSYCNIKHVTNQMFSKMDGLTNLNLKGNSLVKIQQESFLSLKNLRHIDLSVNDLDQVSSLLFYRNPELDVIRLNDNPRLTQLPPDGFQSHTGHFNVYLFDVSNCAIGALGHKSFSTMPRLTTLKLAWNNINYLDKGTFIFSDRLSELDLSNNLIVKLDELTFLHNRELTKVNLAGNPIKKLSAKLFLPLSNLKELDVSECELTTLLADNYYGIDQRFEFYKSLRYFNASFNQIKKISKEDVQFFKNLKTLDISNNPLKCNDDFKGLMKWLGKRGIVAGKVPTNADSENPLSIASQTIQTWDDLARSVCKRNLDAFKPPIEVSTEGATVEKTKQLLNEAKEDIEEDTSLGEDTDDDDDDEEDDGEYEYNDEDPEGEIDVKDIQPIIKDKGVVAEEVNLFTETDNKFLRDKLGDDSEEIIIKKGKIYYTSYAFLWPILIILFSTIVILLSIAKIVSLLMRKRGERYRQALLASKNSIVYQKLTEEINSPKHPKYPGYAPIQQV